MEEVDHAVAFTNEQLVAQCGHLEQVEVTDLQRIEGSKGDVDVVVAWVDGRDPEHRAKRKRYLAHPGGDAKPERAAHEQLAVEFFDRVFRDRAFRIFHERKAPGTSGFTIERTDDLHLHGAGSPEIRDDDEADTLTLAQARPVMTCSCACQAASSTST